MPVHGATVTRTKPDGRGQWLDGATKQVNVNLKEENETLDDPIMDRVLMGLECSLAGP